MKVLIVLAHPEPNSLNAHLAWCARDTLSSHVHRIQISDLYASRFDPREAAWQFAARCNPQRFDVQVEQQFAWEHNALPSDVHAETKKVISADLLILHFPLWWFGLPAILKGWIDRVFVYGGLYSGARTHDRGPCRGKRILMCVTTGSSEMACSHNGREGDTHLMLWPHLYTLRYVGFTVLQPFLIHGVRGGLRGEEEQAHRAYVLRRILNYRELLTHIDDAPVVPFNSDDDFDSNGTLKPGAPVYSPFIGHERRLCLTESV